MSITADSTIIAAVVSAIVSVSILLVSNYIIQPGRYKHTLQVENLEKRLEAYGALITIIDSMLAKGKRQLTTSSPKARSESPFLMENPYDYNRLLAIIENRNYLLSKEISQLWYKLLEQDQHFSILTALKEGSGVTGINVKEMQDLAKKDYSELKTQYKELTGIRLPN
jgi:hypothetical protein